MQRKDIYRETTQYFLHPIAELLQDPDVSEILINGYDTVYYEKAGKLQRADVRFSSEESLMAAARNIAEFVHRSIGGDDHSMDARLPDGSRVHVIVPPSSRQGVCFSIRRFRKSSFDLPTLIRWKSITEEVADFFRVIVLAHKNTVISGGTGTGKTSMLNAISSAIPKEERIVVIEDSSELQLHQPHTVYLEAQPPRPDGSGQVSVRDLFVDSLRMRPDRIVVGEVRRGEALDLIQSMISGHAGALTTVHASNPRDAAIRLETLTMMSDVALPSHVARRQIASAIHLVIQIARLRDGTRRVMLVTEAMGLDADNEYVMRDIFRFEGHGMGADGKLDGQLEWTGYSPSFADEIASLGLMDQTGLAKRVFVSDSAAAPSN